MFDDAERIRLVIIGAGGHALSVLDSVDYSRYDLIGFVDEYKSGEFHGLPIFGDKIENVPEYWNCVYFVGIGDCYIRKRWYNTLRKIGAIVINVIDKTAKVSNIAEIGRGNFIGKMAVVNAGAVIGDNNIINSMALLEHERLNEEQAEIVSTACEFYARIRIGQFREILQNRYMMDSIGDDNYLDRAEKAEKYLMEARALIYPDLGTHIGASYGIRKFDDADMAFDVHQVLRYALGDSREPFALDKPLPECFVEPEGEWRERETSCSDSTNFTYVEFAGEPRSFGPSFTTNKYGKSARNIDFILGKEGD